ncbi:hypothetical protein RUM43_000732 [Polyplax serrata]|uniref:Uncharacterized protein n=1 Tax=Polyplax serrata TaxID=468196 RepID=A0AAN8SHL8_POLSC
MATYRKRFRCEVTWRREHKDRDVPPTQSDVQYIRQEGKKKAYSPEIRSPYDRPKSAIPASQDCITNAGPTFHVTIEKVLGNQSCLFCCGQNGCSNAFLGIEATQRFIEL